MVAETGVNRLLAQANLAWLKHPIDDPRIARMRENIQRVNALADTAPGFVWRYQEGEDATGVRVLDDPSILYNCTVWTDLDSLKAYIYRPDHGQMLRQRREWFRPPPHPPNAMWWVEPGHPSYGRRGASRDWTCSGVTVRLENRLRSRPCNSVPRSVPKNELLLRSESSDPKQLLHAAVACLSL